VGAPEQASAIQRKERSLSISVLPRASKKTAPAAVATARPDAETTLKIILDRLDDMKAEETVTIDLRGQSALTDFMIVTTGRANRHVGADRRG
jgi:ribosome-associated protein